MNLLWDNLPTTEIVIPERAKFPEKLLYLSPAPQRDRGKNK